MFSSSVTPSNQITKLIKKLFLKQRITQSFVVPFTTKTCSIERSLRFAAERDSPVIFVSMCGKYLKIASYRQISELLVEESFLKIMLCINFKLQKTSTFLLSPLFMYSLKQMSAWHLTNCLLLILLLLYRCSKSFHTSFSENIQRWEQVSFCSIIVLAGMKKVEWADHVLPICQLITVNRCLKENCSYFTQHWKLKVHMSRKDGHGNNRLFIYKRHPCAALLGVVIFCALVILV